MYINSNSQKQVRSVEKTDYNAVLELAIEKDNNKVDYIQNSKKKDNEDYYNLVIEEPIIKSNNTSEDSPLLQNINIPNTAKALIFPISSTDLLILIKSRNLSLF